MQAQSPEIQEVKTTGNEFPFETTETDAEAIGDLIEAIQGDLLLVQIDEQYRAHLLHKSEEDISSLTFSEQEALPYAVILNKVDVILAANMDIIKKEAALIDFFQNECPKEMKIFAENHLIDSMKNKMMNLADRFERQELDLNEKEVQVDLYAFFNIRIRRLYAVTQRTKRVFAIECAKFYRRIVESKKVPANQLSKIHDPLTTSVYTVATSLNMTDDISENAKKVSIQSPNEELKIGMPSINGDDSCHWCYEFPRLDTDNQDALNIIADAREELIELISKITTFKALLEVQDLNLKEFFEYCSKFKEKLHEIYLNAAKIQKIADKAKLKNENIAEYLKLLEIHLINAWENAVMPAFILYAKIFYGENVNGI